MVSQTNWAAAAVMGALHSAHVGSRCDDEDGPVDSVTLPSPPLEAAEAASEEAAKKLTNS